jgi:hypothetical protein
VVDECRVQFGNEAALVNLVISGVDVEPPVHIVAYNGLAPKFIHY